MQGTKAEVYPHYYTQAVVDFFGRLHSIDNIAKDIEAGKIDVFIVDEKIVGQIIILQGCMSFLNMRVKAMARKS